MNWTPRNKLRWHFNQNITAAEGKAFENMSSKCLLFCLGENGLRLLCWQQWCKYSSSDGMMACKERASQMDSSVWTCMGNKVVSNRICSKDFFDIVQSKKHIWWASKESICQYTDSASIKSGPSLHINWPPINTGLEFIWGRAVRHSYHRLLQTWACKHAEAWQEPFTYWMCSEWHQMYTRKPFPSEHWQRIFYESWNTKSHSRNVVNTAAADGDIKSQHINSYIIDLVLKPQTGLSK